MPIGENVGFDRHFFTSDSLDGKSAAIDLRAYPFDHGAAAAIHWKFLRGLHSVVDLSVSGSRKLQAKLRNGFARSVKKSTSRAGTGPGVYWRGNVNRNVIPLLGVVLAAAAGGAGAQPNRGGAPQNLDNVELHLIPVQGNVYMLMGAGGNVTIQAGSDGVLLVDTMFAPLAPRIAAEIKKISPLPIRYIIDTHVHGDHIGGNEALAKMGAPGASPTDTGGATIIAHENVVNRMTKPAEKGQTPAATPGLPNDEYFTRTKDFYFNGEPIFVIHEPNAHTDGDSIVLFRRSDTISAGDIFTPERYPIIDLERGGSVQGELDALNHILHLTVPARLQEGGTRVIPGHGRLCDEAEVVEYRNMITIVRDRIQAMIKQGMTLEQVQAARPTLDYDPQYGSGERFVEAVYKSLSKPPSRSSN